MFEKIIRRLGFIRKLKRCFVPSAADRYDHVFADLHNGSLAIDCGANVGEVTGKMAKNGATVYAFEPNPYAFAQLARKFAKDDNVVCINKAVLDRNTKVKLFFHEKSDQDEVYWSTGSSILDFKTNVDTNKSCEVEAIDLVEFIKDLNRFVDVLKIDVEGAECPIINKIIDSGIYRNIGTILVETHDDKIPELAAETEVLRKKISAMRIGNIVLDWT